MANSGQRRAIGHGPPVGESSPHALRDLLDALVAECPSPCYPWVVRRVQCDYCDKSVVRFSSRKASDNLKYRTTFRTEYHMPDSPDRFTVVSTLHVDLAAESAIIRAWRWAARPGSARSDYIDLGNGEWAVGLGVVQSARGLPHFTPFLHASPRDHGSTVEIHARFDFSPVLLRQGAKDEFAALVTAWARSALQFPAPPEPAKRVAAGHRL